MEPRFPQPWSLARDLVDITKRVFSLERQFSTFKRVRILDDLDDTETLYDDTSTQPDGTTVAPQDGDVLLFDGSRTSEFGGLWVPGTPSWAIGPTVCNRYEHDGITTYEEADIFDGVDTVDGMWLVTCMVDAGNGTVDASIYINAIAGSYYIAADRTVTSAYSSYDMASVAFLWWREDPSDVLQFDIGANESDGTDMHCKVTFRAIRLGDAPTGATCGSFSGGG